MLLNPAGANGVGSLRGVRGTVDPALQAFHSTWSYSLCSKVLAAGVLGARIHSGAESMLIWGETSCGSVHSTPQVRLWEVHHDKEGCLRGPGPGVPLALQMRFAPLRQAEDKAHGGGCSDNQTHTNMESNIP